MKPFLIALHLILLANAHEESQQEVETFGLITNDRKYLSFGPDFRFKSDSVNKLCNRQLNHFQESLDHDVIWARKMRDAWGNVPSGIFSGNLFDFGNFDQCLNLQHSTDSVGKIFGQHCTLMIPFERVEDNQLAKINTFSQSPSVNLRLGICIPKSCSPEDVEKFADETFKEKFNISLRAYNQNMQCDTREKSDELTRAQIFASFFFASFIALLASSTAYEITCNVMLTKKSYLLSSFSVYTNSKTIMTMKPLVPKEMLFLHGIRSLAIIWIVVGHTFNVGVWLTPSINHKTILESFQSYFTMILFSSYFGVNTFFMLSSMLLTLSVFRELDKTNKISLPKLYFKRYLRITIPLAACIIFTLGFLMEISDGPLWKSIMGFHLNLCHKWWWTTLLYVGNHVNPGAYCFWHSWYLMVDMQLYFLSPLVLYPLWRFRNRVSFMIPMIFAVASSSVIFIFASYVKNQLRVSHLSATNGLKDVLVYSTTYGRIDSWMMGIFIGYIMTRIEGKTVCLPKGVVIAGWTLTASVMLSAIFGQYPLQQESFKDIAVVTDAAYDSLKGISWGLALAWIIIACHLSYGGIVKRFLSLSIWLPISKLSFCIYLVHVPLQAIYVASVRNPVYYSLSGAVYMFFGNFSVSFIVAFVWALMFEYPILTIIAIALAKKKASEPFLRA